MVEIFSSYLKGNEFVAYSGNFNNCIQLKSKSGNRHGEIFNYIGKSKKYREGIANALIGDGYWMTHFPISIYLNVNTNELILLDGLLKYSMIIPTEIVVFIVKKRMMGGQYD